MLGAGRGWAFLPPERAPLPNIDPHVATGAGAAAVTAEQRAEVAELRSHLPRARVDFDEVTGGPVMVSVLDGMLTGAAGRGPALPPASFTGLAADDANRVTKAFLKQHSKLFGFGPESLDQARIKREFVGAHNGLRTVVWQQQVEGIPIFEAVLISHTTQDGRAGQPEQQVRARPRPGHPPRRTQPIRSRNPCPVRHPSLGPGRAESSARTRTAEAVTAEGEPAASPERSQKFKAKFLLGEGEAKLAWLPLAGEKLRLCWEVILTSHARGEMFLRTGGCPKRRSASPSLPHAIHQRCHVQRVHQ